MRKALQALAGLATGAATFGLLAAPVLAQRYDLSDADTAAAGTAFAGIMIVYYLCVCCLVILGIALKVWNAYSISKDAEYKKMDNGVLWAILYFIFGDIALGIYFYQQRALLKNEVPMLNKEVKVVDKE
jgi:hypothetical protein